MGREVSGGVSRWGVQRAKKLGQEGGQGNGHRTGTERAQNGHVMLSAQRGVGLQLLTRVRSRWSIEYTSNRRDRTRDQAQLARKTRTSSCCCCQPMFFFRQGERLACAERRRSSRAKRRRRSEPLAGDVQPDATQSALAPTRARHTHSKSTGGGMARTDQARWTTTTTTQNDGKRSKERATMLVGVVAGRWRAVRDDVVGSRGGRVL